MKTYRKISSWLADVRKELVRPTMDGPYSRLSTLGWDFKHLADRLTDDPGQARDLVAVLRQFREGRGAGRGVFEECVMERLCRLVHNACGKLLDGGFARQPAFAVPDSLPRDLRPSCEVVLDLCWYAMDCLTYSRQHDSLSGNRRRFALELLGEASFIFDMPEEVLAFVCQALKTGRRPSVHGAILFCDSYYKARDISVPEDVEALLLAFAKRTDSHGLAVGALDVLVQAGNVDELDALDRMDDWKERLCL